jgi:hypothetical protein
MTTSELSTQFDILFNNITSNQAPGLNEYEKSVFLTKAQSQLVNEYFNNKTDGFGGGFDGSQKRQYDFSSIIKTASFNEATNTNHIKLDNRSRVFLFPEDYYLAVNEVILCNPKQYSVIPLDYSEYQRLMLKPYNLPPKRAAWRIITGKSEETPIAEIIGNFANNSISYTLRYIKVLSPIILEDLSEYGDDISIDTVKIKSECELPEETHQEILERAVALAKIAWQGGTYTQAQSKE